MAFLHLDPVAEKFLQKNALFTRKKSKISEENVFKLVHLTEIQRNKLKNWIIYNILQIDLTNQGNFSK